MIGYRMSGALSSLRRIDLALAGLILYFFFYVIGAMAAGIDIVNLISPSDDTWINGTNDTIQFQFNFTGDNATASCELFIDGIGYYVNSSVLNETDTTMYANDSLSEGTYTWYVNCTNTTTINSTTWTLNIDRTAPLVTLIAPEGNYNTSQTSLDFQFNVTDNLASTTNCSLYVNNSLETYNATTVNATTTNFTRSVSVGLAQNWTVNCSDSTGSTHQPSVRIFNIDLIPPDLNLVSPTLGNNSYTSNVSWIYVNVSSTETIGGCLLDNTSVNQTMTVNGDYCYLNLTGLANLTSQYFYVYANDSAGNLNTTEHRNITVNLTQYPPGDSTPPDITFVTPTPNNETTTANYTYINLTIDEPGYCLLDWNGTNESMSNATHPETYFVNKTLLINGNYTFTSWCNDTIGNLNQSEMRWVYINWTADPFALTDCQTISTAGVYTLQNNVSNTSTCFNITADDVIIDGNFYYINYSGSSTGYAIYASGVNNLTVQDLHAYRGNDTDVDSHTFYTTGSDNITVENVTFYENTDGSSNYVNSIYFVNTGDVLINNSNISTIYLNNVDSSLFENNYVRTSEGSYNSIVYLTGSSSNNFTNSQFVRGEQNSNFYLNIQTSSSYNRFENNTWKTTSSSSSSGQNPTIMISSSTENVFVNENITTRTQPLSIEGTTDVNFNHTFTNVTIESKNFWYNHSLANQTIMSNGDYTNIGFYACGNCDNVTIENSTFYEHGIAHFGSTSMKVKNVNITGDKSTLFFTYAYNGNYNGNYNSYENLIINLSGGSSYTSRYAMLLDDDDGILNNIIIYSDTRGLNIDPYTDNVTSINLDINTTGQGLSIYGINHTAHNITITSTSSYGLIIGAFSENFSVYNTEISGSSGDIRFDWSGDGDLFLYNVTYNTESFVGSDDSEIYNYEYVDVNVTNSSSDMLSGANITAIDTYSTEQGSDMSSSTDLNRLTIITKMINSTTTVDYNNYTFYANLSGYINTSTEINITNSSVYTGSSHIVLQLTTMETTPPNIIFTPPTPNNQTTTANYTYINLTISEPGYCLLDWNGTNETMSNTTQSETYFVNKTEQQNGNYTFSAWCNDTLGNLNQSEMRWVYINYTVPDSTPPSVTLILPIDNYNTSQTTLDFQFNVTDSVSTTFNCSLFINNTFITYNASTLNATTTNFTRPVSVELNQNWTVNCTDLNNNSHQPDVRIFNIDTTPPVVTITYPLNTTYYNVTYFNFTVVEANLDTCWYNNGSGNTTTACQNDTTLFLTEGTQALEVYSNDSAGNIGSDSVSFTLDQTEPDITITYPSNATISNDTFSFTYSDVNCSWYSVDGSSNITNCSVTGNAWPGTLSVTQDGYHNVTVWANDSVGNTNSTTRYWTRDTAPPGISTTFPANYSNLSLSWINITGMASDSNPDTITINDTIFGSNLGTFNSWNFTNTSMDEGFYSVLITAVDTLSQQNSTELHFRIDRTGPTFTDIDNQTIQDDEALSYDINATDPSGVSCFTVNDITNFTITCGGILTNATSLTAAVYWLEITANDTLNNQNPDSIYVNVTATDVTDPVVTITYPLNTTYYNVTYFNFTLVEANQDSCWYNLNSTGNTSMACGNNTAIPTAEGSNTLEVYANDTANNIGGDTVYFTTDWTDPVVSLLYPADNYNTSQGSIDFQFNVTDNVSTTFNCSLFVNNTLITYNASTLNSSTTNFTVPVSVTLDQNWTINCTDEGGNSNQSTLRKFNVDQTPPSVTIYLPQPTNYSDNNTIPLNYTVSDTSGIHLCWYNAGGGTNYTTGCSNTTFNVSGEGTFTVYFYVNDTSGNINNTESVTFDIDMTAPAVIITYPFNTTYYNVTYFNFTLSETADTCWYNTDGGSNTSFSCGNNTAVSLMEGQRFIEVYANDSVNNIGGDTEYFTLDQTGPDITFQLPAPNNQTTTANYTYINLTISEQGYCLLDWNGTNESMSNTTQAETYFVNKTEQQNGNYTFSAWCNDTIGNLNHSETRWIYINWTVPPPPDLTPPTITINLPLNTTTNDDTFNVTFGEGVNWSAYEIDSSGTNISMGAVSTYEMIMGLSSDGPHEILVWANDSSGNLNSSIRYWIRDTTAPDIANVSNESITAISALIRWNTTEAANSSVSYGTAVSMLNESSSSASLTQGHRLTIQYLTKNTTYFYNVTSCDNITNCNTSGPRSFKTPECTSNWGCGAWSSCSGGQQTRTCTDANQCQYPWTYQDTQSCVDSPGGGTSGSTTAPQNVTTDINLTPGESILNNTELQETMQEILEKTNLSGVFRDNLIGLSFNITPYFTGTRNMQYSGGFTKLKTTLRYNGTWKLKNVIVFETLPKTFTTNASTITVTAAGAEIEIVEEDPSWLITYAVVNPDDELVITYESSGTKSSSVPENTETEIYAESLEEITEPAQQVNITEPVSCTPLMIRCHGKEVQQCSIGGDVWTVLETCDNECNPQTLSCALEPAPERPGFSFDMIPVIIILVILLFVVIVFMGAKSIKREKKPRPMPKKREEPKIEEKPKPVPEKKEETKEKPLLHRPEEISKDIREGEPDVIIAGVETGKRAFVKKQLKSVAEKLPIKRPVEGEETKEKPPLHRPEEISKDIKDGEPDVALADIEIVRKAAPKKDLKKTTKRTPLKRPAINETVKKKVKKRMDAAERIEAVRPDVTVVTLSDIHRIAKKRKKKEKPPKKIADTDAKLKKIGKVAFEMPKMRLNLEALEGEMEGHEEAVTEVRHHEDNLHWQVEEVMTSLSSLRDHITEKMAKKKLEEKEADSMLEKTSKSINTRVNIMSRNLDEALERLSKRMDDSSKIGKIQMESNIQFLRNQIGQLRSELPKHAGKKDTKKIKKKREKKEELPEEAQPSEKEIAKAVPQVRMPAEKPEEEVTDEKVRISDLGHFKGKEVIMEVELELIKTAEEEGTKMYGYNLKDETGEIMMTSTQEIRETRVKVKCAVNETLEGKLYLRFLGTA